MKIRSFFALNSLFMFIILSAVVYLTILSIKTSEEKVSAENKRHDAFVLADYLRRTSNDLTRMIRAYSVTGDLKFKAYFETILGIRNGTLPRPNHYFDNFWDLIIPDEKLYVPTGKKKPLQELLKELGLTKKEHSLLEMALHRSEKLVALEVEAFAAMSGVFKNIEGVFTYTGKPNSDYARELLFSKEYFQAKKEIMEPITKFNILMNQRTSEELASFHEFENQLLIAIVVLVSFLVLVETIYFYLLHKKITLPLEEVTAWVGRIIERNFKLGPKPKGHKEINQLVDAFSIMAQNIKENYSQLEAKSEKLRIAKKVAEDALESKNAQIQAVSAHQ